MSAKLRRIEERRAVLRHPMDVLVCPASGLSLEPRALPDAERVAGQLEARPWMGSRLDPTAHVLLRSDHQAAYPIVEGIPVLLGQRVLVPKGTEPPPEPPHLQGMEEEIDFYDRKRHGATFERFNPRNQDEVPSRGEIPLIHPYDAAAHEEVLAHLKPYRGRMLQIGGRGWHAVAFAVNGAEEGWLVSPSLGEVLYGRDLAERAGVADRFFGVVGLAEQLPLADQAIDLIYSEGTVHHLVVEEAMPEVARVLRPRGRFAAVEPWRGPGYDWGIRVFGKREKLNCRPLTPSHVAPFDRAFGWSLIRHHGTFTRYPMVALGRLGYRLPVRTGLKITRLDDRLSGWLGLRDYGSSVALLAAK